MNDRTMRLRFLLSLTGLAVTLLLSISDREANARDDSQADLNANGWVLDKLDLTDTNRPGVRHVCATGRYQLPADQVWKAIADKQNTENWPGIRESIIEKVRGDTMIRRYVLDVPIYPDRTYRLRMIRDDERMRLQFERIPGYGNVNEIRGTWEVRSLSPFESEVTYTLDTDPGAKLIPGFIIKWATKKVIPRSFALIHDMATGGAQHSMKLNRPLPSAY